MDIRSSAVDLTDEQRDRFLTAVILLKNRPAPGAPAGVSIYDQFVALHQAAMAVMPPGAPPGQTINYGHWGIGFCAWHRQYLRVFERALQRMVPGVTLPYWDWTDHAGASSRLFVDSFLGSLRTGAPAALADSAFRSELAAEDRPAWWPPEAGPYLLHPALAGTFGRTLHRGSEGIAWPPPAVLDEFMAQYVVEGPDGEHPFWYFWIFLEAGLVRLPTGVFGVPTHNTAHGFIGGHMSSPAVSPNDPVFWLHHANVDRLWANWQARRLAAVPGSVPRDHYPPTDQGSPVNRAVSQPLSGGSAASPFNGTLAPLGHDIDDPMWPWVGGIAGYDVNVSPRVRALLPSFTADPVVTVHNVLDTGTLDPVGYRYAPPAGG
jgi:tyrosinase